MSDAWWKGYWCTEGKPHYMEVPQVNDDVNIAAPASNNP